MMVARLYAWISTGSNGQSVARVCHPAYPAEPTNFMVAGIYRDRQTVQYQYGRKFMEKDRVIISLREKALDTGNRASSSVKFRVIIR